MKYLIHTLLALGLMATSACQSGGKSQANSTVKNLNKFQMELQKGQDSINKAVETLNALYEEGGDMAEEYAMFCDAVDGVESQRDRVRSVHASLGEERESYVQAWEEGLANIQNASMKEKAMERRDAVVEKFEDLSSSGQETRETFDAWFADISDIKTVLSFDLNPTGVKELDDEIESIGKRAGKINKGLEEFTESIGKLVAALEAAKPPPAEGEKS